jgi:hypothetical protein
MITLYEQIERCVPLNDAQIMHLMKLLGYGCRRQVKEKLERRLKFAHIQRNQLIYDNLIVSPDIALAEVDDYEYADYIADINTIRKMLIG